MGPAHDEKGEQRGSEKKKHSGIISFREIEKWFSADDLLPLSGLSIEF